MEQSNKLGTLKIESLNIITRALAKNAHEQKIC